MFHVYVSRLQTLTSIIFKNFSGRMIAYMYFISLKIHQNLSLYEAPAEGLYGFVRIGVVCTRFHHEIKVFMSFTVGSISSFGVVTSISTNALAFIAFLYMEFSEIIRTT